MNAKTRKPSANGRGSFCIPHAAVTALLDAQADAITIGAYLTLARFTDGTNRFSPAAVSAISEYVGLHKQLGRKGQPSKAARALDTLQAITVGKGQNAVPLVYARDKWEQENDGAAIPDGPIDHARIRSVLPDFNEPLTDRVWFSNELVTGHGTFKLPLKKLKQAGDDAARLFLAMQSAVDMLNWGGVPPSAGPWAYYKRTLDGPLSNSRLIHAQRQSAVVTKGLVQRVTGATDSDAYSRTFLAIEALEGCGLFYEVVVVIDKEAKRDKFKSGEEYDNVPDDAAPRYELDARSLHGYKPEGEAGLAWQTARTAGELGHSVAQGTVTDAHGRPVPPEETGIYPGRFTGKYAAILPRGYPAMVAGIYRPRFRPANPRNAGVRDAWYRIHEGNRDGFEWIQSLRQARGLEPLPEPEWLRPAAAKQEQPPTNATPTADHWSHTPPETDGSGNPVQRQPDWPDIEF